eukprot:341692-Prymnesium_polylepis.1
MPKLIAAVGVVAAAAAAVRVEAGAYVLVERPTRGQQPIEQGRLLKVVPCGGAAQLRDQQPEQHKVGR